MGLLNAFKRHGYGPDIWNIGDDNAFIGVFTGRIGQKCHYGAQMEALSNAERTFYIAQQLEMEVNNGGFGQFFNNGSGAFSGEIAEVFRRIGANHTAAICERALSILDVDPAKAGDESARIARLNQLPADAFSECDEAFYRYDDDLTALGCKYIRRNRNSFNV